MFGTNTTNDNLDKLETVLDRQISIDSLEALLSSVNRSPQDGVQLNKVAIGIDSNVFLKIVTHNKCDDIVDYLVSKHEGPLILPGQTIQEYWNNQYHAIPSIATGVKTQFDRLKTEVDKIDPNFSEYASEMEVLLDRFSLEYGYIYDQTTIASTLRILGLLKDRALLSYVPRTRFHSMAINRKTTKTPPGFKDTGDGDFFVWADFLYGLLKAKDENQQFNHVVMLTHDVKKDWSKNGIAHPILTAEVKSLVDVPFDVWKIDQLYQAIEECP